MSKPKSDNPSNQLQWRDELEVHPAAEVFPMMSPDELKALGEDIKKNGLRTDIVLWSATDEDDATTYLLDGRNRLDAMAAVGLLRLRKDDDNWGWLLEQSSCKGHVNLVEGSTGADPYALAVSLNIHRRHLSGEQKREIIAKLLKADPSKSDRQVAKPIKVDHKTVGAIRSDMVTRGEIPHVATRVDTKGRKQPAKKGPRSARTLRPSRARKRAEKKAAAASNPVQERCADHDDTAEEHWQRSLGNLAGDAISMRAFWTREFGHWEKFKAPSSLRTLARQAAQAWTELATAIEPTPAAGGDEG
jgi:hypothetical protein